MLIVCSIALFCGGVQVNSQTDASDNDTYRHPANLPSPSISPHKHGVVPLSVPVRYISVQTARALAREVKEGIQTQTPNSSDTTHVLDRTIHLADTI